MKNFKNPFLPKFVKKSSVTMKCFFAEDRTLIFLFSHFLFSATKMLQNSFKAVYRPNFYESTCLRCNETVYQVDRVGPLKDFTFFHSGCFKCAVCGTKLTLKTYYNNQHRQEDKEVYCSSHVPKIGPGHLDGSSVGIRSALNVPKSSNFVNEQIRGPSEGKTTQIILFER